MALIGSEEYRIPEIVDILLKNNSMAEVLCDKMLELARKMEVPFNYFKPLQKSLKDPEPGAYSEGLNQMITSWAATKAHLATPEAFIAVLCKCDLKSHAEQFEDELHLPRLKELEKKKDFVPDHSFLQEFLNSDCPILILGTLDRRITIQKLKDTYVEPMHVQEIKWDDIKGANYFQANRNAELIVLDISCCVEFSVLIPKLLNLRVDKIVVAVAKEHAKTFKRENFSDVTCLNDVISWSNLRDRRKAELLSTSLFSQISLGAVVGNDNTQLESVLTEDCLIDLINGRKPRIFEIDKKIDYYVNRKLQPRYNLSNAIFDGNEAEEIYVFTGIDAGQLAAFAKNQVTDISGKVLEKSKNSCIKNLYMILNPKSDFEKLCKRNQASVHWIDYTGLQFRWVKSWLKPGKSMAHLRSAMLSNGTSSTLTEENFLLHIQSSEATDISRAPVCISDTPGMGKSIVLASLGKQLCQKYSDRTIVLLDMKDVILELKNEGCAVTSCIVKEILTKVASRSQTLLQHHVLQYTIQNINFKIELMIDGFDEIQTEDLPLAYDLFTLINNELKNVRLWITTRPHYLQELEDCLHVLGYNLNPLSREDQEHLLVDFWWSQTKDKLLDKESLRSYSRSCLSSVKTILTAYDIAGIPLQCKLIADVYQESAVEFATIDNAKNANYELPFSINSVSELYEKNLNVKFDIFLKKYCSAVGSAPSRLDFWNVHIYFSLCQLFPNMDDKFKKELFDGNSIADNDLHKTGILEAKYSTTKELQFAHRTYAEFLVAYFVYKILCMEKCDDELLNFVFQNVLSTRPLSVSVGFGLEVFGHGFRHETVSCFLDNILSKNENFEKTKLTLESNNLAFIQKNAIVTACVRDNFHDLFLFIEKANILHDVVNQIFHQTLIIIATRTAESNLFEIVCEYYKSQKKEVNSIKFGGKSLLDIAVRYRERNIAEFLVKMYGCGNVLQNFEQDPQHFIRICVEDSLRDSANVVWRKLEVLSYLWSVEEGESGTAPLFTKQVHIDLLIKLATMDVNALSIGDSKGNTLLHTILTTDGYSRIDYNKLIRAVPSNLFPNLINKRGLSDCVPLCNALKSDIGVDAETLELFKSGGADFSAVDAFGNTLFHFAALGNNSIQCLDGLRENNASLGGNNEGATPLHFAAKAGNLTALKYFVGSKLSVTEQDNEGRTPFDYAMSTSYGTQAQLKVAIALEELISQENGSCRFTSGFAGRSSYVFRAIKEVDLEKLKLLLRVQEGAVHFRDEQNNTPLHEVMLSRDQRFQIEACKLLIDGRAEVVAVNSDNMTPLECILRMHPYNMTFELFQLFREQGLHNRKMAQLALEWLITKSVGSDKNEFKQTLKLLKSKGAKLDANKTDENGDTWLQRAANSNCMLGIQYLLNFPKIANKPIYYIYPSARAEELLESAKRLFKAGHPLNIPNEEGATAMHFILKSGDLPTVKYLIEKKALDNMMGFLVCYAAHYAPFEVVRYLCSVYTGRMGKLLSEITLDRWGFESVLHAAIENHTKDISGNKSGYGYEKLIPYLSNFEDIKEAFSKTGMGGVLHRYINKTSGYQGWRHPFYTLVNRLLKLSSNLSNSKDKNGTPLLLAPGIHPDLLLLLLDRNADPDVRDSEGYSVVHLVSKYYRPEQYHMFMHGLAERKLERTFMFKNKFGVTPLHFAVSHLEIMEQTLHLFKAYKVDFDSVDANNESIFVTAIRAGRSPLFLRTLMEFDCGMSSSNKEGASALHAAAEVGNLGAIELLTTSDRYNNGPAIDNNGNTFLHYLFKKFHDKQCKMAELLVPYARMRYGISVNELNNSYRTALEEADEAGCRVDVTTRILLERESTKSSQSDSSSSDGNSSWSSLPASPMSISENSPMDEAWKEKMDDDAGGGGEGSHSNPRESRTFFDSNETDDDGQVELDGPKLLPSSSCSSNDSDSDDDWKTLEDGSHRYSLQRCKSRKRKHVSNKNAKIMESIPTGTPKPSSDEALGHFPILTCPADNCVARFLHPRALDNHFKHHWQFNAFCTFSVEPAVKLALYEEEQHAADADKPDSSLLGPAAKKRKCH